MPEHPDPIDLHIGRRLRLRRQLLGLSQEGLGRKIGLTFQQVQKYERGANRLSASRLWQLCDILEVPIAFFFESIEDSPDAMEEINKLNRGMSENSQTAYVAEEIDDTAEIQDLIGTVKRVKSRYVRKQFFEFVKAVAHETGGYRAEGDEE